LLYQYKRTNTDGGAGLNGAAAGAAARTQFTGCTSTKVQILTEELASKELLPAQLRELKQIEEMVQWINGEFPDSVRLILPSDETPVYSYISILVD